MKKQGIRLLSVIISILMLVGIFSGAVLAVDKPDYQYGTMEYYSTVTGEFISDSYYYTDQWFLGDASVRNDSLALVSTQLSSAAADDTHAVSFLKELGFADASAERYDSNRPDDCAYTIGSKRIEKNGSGCTLIAVAFQGAQYGSKGWQQNISVNSDTVVSGDHAAYSAAAEVFLKDLSERDTHGDVIVWLTGQSRGGAVANLTAAYLRDRKNPPAVFACTFESPSTTSKTEEAGSEMYNGIHNYLCEDDPLAMLPVWGMVRYGQTVLYNSTDTRSVIEQLEVLNPGAYAYAQEYNTSYFDGNVKSYLQKLQGMLEQTVPEREKYSEENTDRFKADSNEEQVITYTYQNGLGALCEMMSGGEERLAERLSSLLENETLISCLVYSYLEENYALSENPSDRNDLLNDAFRKRWIAADELYRMMTGENGQSLYSREDLYALLKILSPLIIDAGRMESGDGTVPAFDEDFYALDYLKLVQILKFGNGIKTLLFSHHSDMIIARLKLLAPDPRKSSVADCRRDRSCPVSLFNDASPGAWYHDGIHWVLETGIMNGTGGDHFDPAGTATRAMFVTVLWRIENQPGTDAVSLFRDVPAGQWYTDAVSWAAANGIVKGYSSDYFGGADRVSREQIVTILYRYAKYKGMKIYPGDRAVLNRYIDSNTVSGWAEEAFCWSLEAGIVQGFENGKLSPETDATRAQVAMMIMRYGMMRIH